MNRTQSQVPMPTFEPSGGDLNIFWDERETTRETEGGSETVYDYAYCVARVGSQYPALVAAIIRSQYTTDEELAAINSAGERYDAYQAFRVQAKALARTYLGLPPPTLEEQRKTARLSRAKFKLALMAGGYLDAIEAAYPHWPKEIQIMWDDSLTFGRLHPSLLAMAEAMQYTAEQMDAVFGIGG